MVVQRYWTFELRKIEVGARSVLEPMDESSQTQPKMQEARKLQMQDMARMELASRSLKLRVSRSCPSLLCLASFVSESVVGNSCRVMSRKRKHSSSSRRS
jgi:hypothetical protein